MENGSRQPNWPPITAECGKAYDVGDAAENVTTASMAASKSSAAQTTKLAVFKCTSRPNFGSLGYPILLRTNNFQLSIPYGYFYRYNINIQPEKCPRNVKFEIFETMVKASPQVFGDLKPVFDGFNNLYTRRPLLTGHNELQFETPLPGNDRIVSHVTVNFVSHISLDDLRLALERGVREVPYQAVNALNAILRHLPNLIYTPVERSFYHKPLGRSYSLGGGREVWSGFHECALPSMWKMLVTIDVCSTGFYKDQPIIDFLCEVLQIKNVLELRKPLTESQSNKFSKEIIGLSVETTHHAQIRRKYRTTGLTTRPAQFQTFPREIEAGENIECTVAKYFLEKYNVKLKYPYLPCLVGGPVEKHIYLPLEVCKIVAGQRNSKKLTEIQTKNMLKVTPRTAVDREKDIKRLVRKEEVLNNNDNLKEFGLSISPNMLELRGRVLPAPKLLYCESQRQLRFIVPDAGMWDMRGKSYYCAVSINEWAIVSFVPDNIITETLLRCFVARLRKISNGAGLRLTANPCFCKYAKGIEQVQPLLSHLKKKYPAIQLVLVFLPGKTNIYNEVKRIGDTVLGLMTQCVQSKNVLKPTSQTLSNLCLKINTKCGGINTVIMPSTQPFVFQLPIIFLGIDFAYPSHGESKLSIAAVVGSIDNYPWRYAATVRVQQSRNGIAEKLSSMAREVLLRFYKSTGGIKPHRIIIYHNGILPNQYSKVLQHQLVAVRTACLNLEAEYRPGITYIMVQRRHHTRLFCVDKKDRSGPSGNVPAGTTVDSGITHPNDFDFYLCSHQGVQGTSRPAHYQILWDDNDFSADELQCLTYQLCYTYARCTRSVSIPTPAYYAHLVCARAKYHMNKETEIDENTLSESHVQDAIERSLIVHADTKNCMYFT